MRPSWKFVLLAAVAVATLVAATSQAEACWGCRPASPVYYATYYYPTCSVGWCDPCYTCYSPAYSCYRPCARACSPCGWTTGCGWSSCYTSCCGGTVSVATGCCGAVSVPAAAPAPAITPAVTPSVTPEPTKAIKTPATPAPDITVPDLTPPAAAPPAAPKDPGASLGPTVGDSGSITVWVPADAKVTINGLATRATGSKRQFVSFGLQPGLSYRYEIRAEITREGRVVSDTRTVTLTAGQRGAVAFGFNGAARKASRPTDRSDTATNRRIIAGNPTPHP